MRFKGAGAVALAIGLVALGACSSDGGSDAARPSTTTTSREREPKVDAGKVQGPVMGGTHGFPQTAAVLDIDAAGYVEEEFLLSGTASSYAPTGDWTADGRWPVRVDGTADYVTRLLVRRPADPDRFNGTVVV